MKKFFVVFTLSLAGVAWGFGTAAGDTRAPSTQNFVMECGGATINIVSPTFSALAAQIVGSTGTAVLQRAVLSDGTVLFEQPSFQAHKADALTTCTQAFLGETVTVTVLMTPQGNDRPNQ